MMNKDTALLTAAILRIPVRASIPDDPAPETTGIIDKYTDYSVRIRDKDRSATYVVRGIAEIETL